MIEFKHILCPIDFSETSIRALTYASALATWYEAQLEVLHVVPAFEDIPGSGHSGSVIESSRPTSRDGIVSQIRRSLESVGATNLNQKVLAQEGRTHELIVHRAHAQPADLLVMGTHGRGGFNRLLLGSVTREGPADGAVSGPHGAEGCDGEYMDPEEPCEHVDFDIRRRRQHFIDHARQRLHAQLAQEPTTWCEIEEVVAIDRAYKAVLQHVGAPKAELIVMGAQGTGGLELMLYGSNTQHVLRAAPCPVLTVHA